MFYYLMKGNLYGVDVKLSEFEDEISPIAIELNGVNSGTNCFAYEGGFSYYKTFVRTLAAHNGGKPIFIESWQRRKRDRLETIVEKIRLERSTERQREWCQKFSSILGVNFEFDFAWLDDLLEFHKGKLEQEHDDSEDRYYLWASKQEKKPLFIFDEIDYSPNAVIFTLMDGRRIAMNPKEIGVIRSTSSTLAEAPERFQHLFLNTPLIEQFLDYKPFTHFLGAFNRELAVRFAPGHIYGFGVNEKKDSLEFLSMIPSDLIVRKRGGSYCGTGVEILPKQEVIESINGKTYEEISLARIQALSMYITYAVSKGVRLEEYLTVYEAFVDSIPIFNPKTGKYHDGCARVIVYSPPNGKPITLGSQWRLAPYAIDEDASLEGRFRVNLSRGASEMEIELDHKLMIDRFAEYTVEEFEKAVSNYRREAKDAFKDVLEQEPGTKEHDVLRYLYWSLEMAHKMVAIGAVNKGSQGITLFPGFKDEVANVRRRDNMAFGPRLVVPDQYK